MSANSRQIGGDHYKKDGSAPEHWDWAADMPYLEGRCTAYIERHNRKNGPQDLEKALHFLQKIFEKRYGIKLTYEITDHTITTPNQSAASQNPYAGINPKYLAEQCEGYTAPER